MNQYEERQYEDYSDIVDPDFEGEEDLKSVAIDALTVAQTRAVKSNKDYIDAGNFLKEIKFRVSKITAYWKPKKEQAAALHKSLVAAEKDLLAPLEQAESIIKSSMMAYQREQERIRAEAERERRRLEEEARLKAEEVRRLVEEANRKEELDEVDVDILRMAQAEAVAAEGQIAPAPLPVAKVQGVSTRKVWKARVIDDRLVPVTIEPCILLRPIDTKVLDKIAVASAGIAEIPGVEFYQDSSITVKY